MKKLWNVLVLTLALNFLAVAGLAGWLVQSKKLNRDRVHAIKAILFPPASAAPATQPSTQPTTQPTLRLEELLAHASGRNAAEQVEFIQHTFDAQMAQHERKQIELSNLQRQIDLAKAQAARDRATIGVDQKQLEQREQQATRLASDKGFQDSLAVYNSLPAKKVKTIFLGMDDQTMMNYLQAMQPRTAAKIVAEFKSPDEVERVHKVLEKMRLAQAATASASQAAAK